MSLESFISYARFLTYILPRIRINLIENFLDNLDAILVSTAWGPALWLPRFINFMQISDERHGWVQKFKYFDRAAVEKIVYRRRVKKKLYQLCVI